MPDPPSTRTGEGCRLCGHNGPCMHVLVLQSIPVRRRPGKPVAGIGASTLISRLQGRSASSNDVADKAPPQGDPLAELRWHWGSAYNIDCYQGTWTATYKGDTYVMSAISADDLRWRIWDDYPRRKIPRAIGDA
jgi:hypothetical protein